MAENKIYKLYLELLEKYGPPEKYWPQWCKKEKTLRDREIVALGAILTQRTSWHNAEMAILNLKKEGLLSLKKISELKSLEVLVPLVRVAGFYHSKPRRLFEFCTFVVKEHGDIKGLLEENLEDVRNKLLSLYGIGSETADTLSLYALDKPSFVVDEYTQRLVKKEKMADRVDYNFLKNLFEKSLPADIRIYQDFHALIIFSQKEKSGWGMKVV